MKRTLDAFPSSGADFPQGSLGWLLLSVILTTEMSSVGLRGAAGSLLSAFRKESTEIGSQERQKQILASSQAWIYRH